ncbi:MAG: histidine kinase [Saprospiraceae bacterium]|nr:histidine kinase [Saprospiraceae bacterium]
MRILINICLLVGWSALCCGQSPRYIIDSVFVTLENLEAEQKADAHLTIATHYQFLPNAYDSLLMHAQIALDLSEELDYMKGKQRANYYLAMGTWYGKEDFDLAKEYFLTTKELVIEANETERIPSINNAIASLDMMQGKYEEALSQYQEAYDVALDIEDYETVAIISTNMAIIYNNTNDTLNAIKINESALDYLAKTNSPQTDLSTVGIYINLADLYRRTKQMEKNDVVIKKARLMVDSMKMFNLEARLTLAEALTLDEKGKEEELYAFVNKKLPLINETEGKDREIYAFLLYFKGKGLASQQKTDEVQQIIKQLKSRLDGTNVLHKKNLYQFIYDLSERIEDYKNAYFHLDKLKTLNDSLLSVEQKEKILTMERKFELVKKDKEIEEKKVENLELKRNNGFLLSGILGLAVVGLLGYFWHYRKRQKEIAKVNQIEQKMLSLQMNPHFIFNAISSIQNYLFDEGDSKKAIHHLSTFATLMRQMLENSRERFIPLEEEIEFLKNYLNLQKLRFDEKFQYEINIAADIDPTYLSIPPLLTQPFIENAIDHGKIYLVENGLLKINIFKQKGDLVIQIVDNGVGIDNLDEENGQSPLLIKKKSLSITITNERLHLLSKLMKRKFHLEIKPNESGNGTIVNLNVPSVALN